MLPDTLAGATPAAPADSLLANLSMADAVAAPAPGVPDTVSAGAELPRSLVLRGAAPAVYATGGVAPVGEDGPRRVPTGRLVAGSLLGGVLGIAVGAGIGALAGGTAKNDDVYVSNEFTGGVLGGIAGMTLGIPIGIHVANRGHGSLSAGMLTSVLTLVGGGVLVRSGAWPVLPLIPVIQVAGSITVLRRTW